MKLSVLKRIEKKCAEVKKGAIVIVVKNGEPTRVFGLDEYEKMRGVPKKTRPWTRRKKPVESPLGVVLEGRILSSLSRSVIYDLDRHDPTRQQRTRSRHR